MERRQAFRAELRKCLKLHRKNIGIAPRPGQPATAERWIVLAALEYLSSDRQPKLIREEVEAAVENWAGMERRRHLSDAIQQQWAQPARAGIAE
jgi:hypothetical protein